jgi:hypothetical protein
VAKETGETVMSLCEADGEEITVRNFKQGKATSEERRPAIKEITCANIPFPGVKEIKQVELFTKWRECVPQDYKDMMCPKVAFDIIKQQRLEKRERKAKRQKKAGDTIEGEHKKDSEIELVKHPDVDDEETMKQSEEAANGMNLDNLDNDNAMM